MMANQEERLETLENGFNQFKTETIKAYQDVAMELAMIKGLTLDSVGRLKHVDRRFDTVDFRVAQMTRDINDLNVHLFSFEQRVDNRLDAHDKRFDNIDQGLEAQGKHLDGIDQRFEVQDKRFDSIDQRFDNLDNKFDQLLSTLSKLTLGSQQGA